MARTRKPRTNYGGGAPANVLNEGPRYRTGHITAERRLRRERPDFILDGRPTYSRREKTRNRRRRRAQAVDPFEREVNTLAALQFGPQERELGYRRQQETQYGINSRNWYEAHIAQMRAAQAQQNAFSAGLQAAQLGAAGNAATVDTNQNAALIQQLQADAAKRGQTVDPNLIATLQQGVAARQVMGNAGGALLGAQAQAQGAYGVNQLQAAGEQGLQANADNQARQRRLDQFAADLAADKGRFKYNARIEAQDREHKRDLEDAAFGLDQANLAADIADDRADNRRDAAKQRRAQMEADRQYRLDLDKFGADQAKDRYQRRHHTGPYREYGDTPGEKKPKYTQDDKNNAQEDLRRARAMRTRLAHQKIPREDWIAFVSDQKDIDPLIVRAALMPGTLTDRQRAELRRMGIKPRRTRSTPATPYSGPRTGG